MTSEANNRGAGHRALWESFGLSRAAFLTMPRVLMHEMPDHWQARMAQLVREWDAHWDWSTVEWGNLKSTVRLQDRGRMVAMPRALLDYRHPQLGGLPKPRRPREDGGQNAAD